MATTPESVVVNNFELIGSIDTHLAGSQVPLELAPSNFPSRRAQLMSLTAPLFVRHQRCPQSYVWRTTWHAGWPWKLLETHWGFQFNSAPRNVPSKSYPHRHPNTGYSGNPRSNPSRHGNKGRSGNSSNIICQLCDIVGHSAKTIRGMGWHY